MPTVRTIVNSGANRSFFSFDAYGYAPTDLSPSVSPSPSAPDSPDTPESNEVKVSPSLKKELLPKGIDGLKGLLGSLRITPEEFTRWVLRDESIDGLKEEDVSYYIEELRTSQRCSMCDYAKREGYLRVRWRTPMFFMGCTNYPECRNTSSFVLKPLKDRFTRLIAHK